MTIDQEAKALLLREEIVIRYPNGKIKEQYYEVNGEFDGEYKEWYKNGKLWIHCFYKDKGIDGDLKMWDEDDKLIAHQVYKNGKFIKDLSEKIDDNRSRS